MVRPISSGGVLHPSAHLDVRNHLNVAGKFTYLHRNQIGVVSTVRHGSHTLKGAKEMHSEFS
jgi:hypothetical protein